MANLNFETTALGNTILSPAEKLSAMKYCIESNALEDVIGHCTDLLAWCLRNSGVGMTLEQAVNYYTPDPDCIVEPPLSQLARQAQ